MAPVVDRDLKVQFNEATSKATIRFKGVVNSSIGPVAEFDDLNGDSCKEPLRFNEAFLQAAIRSHEIEAEAYPNGSARDNLVQLRTAQYAFAQFKK